jgi:hypothetical protein
VNSPVEARRVLVEGPSSVMVRSAFRGLKFRRDAECFKAMESIAVIVVQFGLERLLLHLIHVSYI